MIKFISLIFSCFFIATSAFSADERPVPHAQLFSLLTQKPGNGNKHLYLGKAEELSGMELSANGDKILIKEAGVYFFLAAGQVGTTEEPGKNPAGYLDLWLVKNGKAIPNTNRRQYVNLSQSFGVLVSQAILRLEAGDAISVGFASNSLKIGLIATPATGNEPALPSLISSIFKLR